MINPVLLAIVDFFLLVMVISLGDYLLFYQASSCPRCGMKPEWYSWIPSTFLELLLFVGGMLFGYFLLVAR
jgi:hypothetical protein